MTSFSDKINEKHQGIIIFSTNVAQKNILLQSWLSTYKVLPTNERFEGLIKQDQNFTMSETFVSK